MHRGAIYSILTLSGYFGNEHFFWVVWTGLHSWVRYLQPKCMQGNMWELLKVGPGPFALRWELHTLSCLHLPKIWSPEKKFRKHSYILNCRLCKQNFVFDSPAAYRMKKLSKPIYNFKFLNFFVCFQLIRQIHQQHDRFQNPHCKYTEISCIKLFFFFLFWGKSSNCTSWRLPLHSAACSFSADISF